ncbi:hypothetical protein CWC48_24285 [Pseudomonas sp. S10E 269]|nr:hypothetical protein CWC49_04735 [Pseudomonas sp. S09F 262]PJK42125.1 hypothetical protein CWC48_24285 [Pseudomonas sp. S10E 269]
MPEPWPTERWTACTRNPCGSGLARESGVPGKNALTDTPLSRASPLPHWICVTHRHQVCFYR